MPEEINRILADHVSTLLFCPSPTAVRNLEREGFATTADAHAPTVDRARVVMSGDAMYDVLLHAMAIAEKRSTVLARLGLAGRRYRMLTIHRAENTDDRDTLRRLVAFVNRVTAGDDVIFPMHPRTAGAYEACGERLSSNVRIIEPLGYFDLVAVLKDASQLLTDSGGLQKEAYWLRVPCVTLRNETEWVETVESGWNTLYQDYPSSRRPTPATDAYGDGHAAEQMVRELCRMRNQRPAVVELPAGQPR